MDEAWGVVDTEEVSSWEETLDCLENLEDIEPKKDLLTPSLTLFLLGAALLGLELRCNVEGEDGAPPLPPPLAEPELQSVSCAAGGWELNGDTGLDDDLRRPNLNNLDVAEAEEADEGSVPNGTWADKELFEATEAVDEDVEVIEELLLEGSK